MITARELVRRCVDVAEHYKTLYVMGCFGAPLTGKNVGRYLNNNAYNRADKRQAMIRAAANKNPPVFGFDCVNLIKGILWGWDGDPSATYGGAKYASNGIPDVSADEMIKLCKGVTDDFRGIVPGAAVWTSGHIGLYIGGGLAVECSPKWKNGVQITAVGNLGGKAGYSTRFWRKWGNLPYVSYEEDDEMSYETFKEYMDRYLKERAEKPVPVWARNTGEWDKAKERGIVTPDQGPQTLLTKVEGAAMILRAMG